MLHILHIEFNCIVRVLNLSFLGYRLSLAAVRLASHPYSRYAGLIDHVNVVRVVARNPENGNTDRSDGARCG